MIPTLEELRGEPAANLLSNLASVSSLLGDGEVEDEDGDEGWADN